MPKPDSPIVYLDFSDVAQLLQNPTELEAFLAERIRFGRITELVEIALDEIEPIPADSLETILEADRKARDVVDKRITRATV